VSKYLLLYRGPATPMEDFTPEQSAEQMKARGAVRAAHRGQRRRDEPGAR
jgi:hypothetical protein